RLSCSYHLTISTSFRCGTCPASRMSAQVPTLNEDLFHTRWTAKVRRFLLHLALRDLRCAAFLSRSSRRGRFFLLVRVIPFARRNQRYIHGLGRQHGPLA